MILRRILGIDFNMGFAQAGRFIREKDPDDIDDEDLKASFLANADRVGIDFEGDLEEEDVEEMVRGVADDIYGDETAVRRAKKQRFANCVASTWANRWARGLAESTQTIGTEDEIGQLFMKMKGCIGMTGSTTSDDERLIPERFR